MTSQESSNEPATLARSSAPVADAAVRGALALQAVMPPPGAETNGAAPGLHAAPTMSGLVQALRRRWLLASTLSLLGAAAAVVIVWFIVPPQFTASARLQVASRSPLHALNHGQDETDFNVFKLNQAAMIGSPLVLSAALNRDEVKRLHLVRDQVNPVPWLEKALKVDFLLGPEIMRVSLSGGEADELAPLVNAVVEVYIDEMAARENGKRAGLVAALKKNQEEEEKKLAERQKALRVMEHNLGLEDAAIMQAKLQAGLAELAQMRRDLRELQLKINDARSVSAYEIDTHARQDSAVLELVKRRAEVQKMISDIRRTALPHLQKELSDGPNRELEALGKALADLIQELRPTIEEDLRKQGNNKVSSLQRNEASLIADINKLEQETNRIKQATEQVDASRRAIAQTEAALNELGRQIATLSMERALGQRITKLQDAETPRTLDLARQIKLAGVAGLGAFGLLLFGVAFMEYRVRRITAVDEVAQGLGLAVVGTLPNLPASARRPLPAGSAGKDLHWQSVMNEAVDAIRTLLLHTARADAVQVVMVTSAVGGEGKTSVASHLAASLARAWRKTLLVDGDLRNPTAHQLFDLPLEPGLSEILRGEVNLSDAIRPTPLSRLWLMPAGHWDSHAVQALAQEGVKAQFAQLKEQYDFIIVDSCPVLPVADALLLGQHVDAVIFSILGEVSRMPTVHAAQQRLAALGIRTLGAVVIGASGDAGSMVRPYPAGASR